MLDAAVATNTLQTVANTTLVLIFVIDIQLDDRPHGFEPQLVRFARLRGLRGWDLELGIWDLRFIVIAPMAQGAA